MKLINFREELKSHQVRILLKIGVFTWFKKKEYFITDLATRMVRQFRIVFLYTRNLRRLILYRQQVN